jgi:hypothetical protein
MKITDKVFRQRQLLHPVRLIIWLCALIIESADIKLWIRRSGNKEQTTCVYYLRIMGVKVPLFEKIIHHLEFENKQGI